MSIQPGYILKSLINSITNPEWLGCIDFTIKETKAAKRTTTSLSLSKHPAITLSPSFFLPKASQGCKKNNRFF